MLGIYVHTNWAYRHPYAARTWTLADWEGYLEGLAALGYDFLMIWPLLDCMPPEPTASDRDYLDRIGRVLEMARHRFGMRTAIVMGANAIGNEKAASYAFAERPYFVCEHRVDPRDPAQVRAFLEGRRRQLEPLRGADALAVIDSDPGGCIGATNEDFAMFVQRQIELYRSLHTDAELIYWMWFGWMPYNRFWEQVKKTGTWGDYHRDSEPEFVATLELIRARIPEPWSLYACLPAHEGPLDTVGVRDKALRFPYGLVEGEPTFPLTNWNPDALGAALAPETLARYPRGVMANAQSHCLQLPHTGLVAHLAHGGSAATMDLAGMAEELVPGLGPTVARGWQAIANPTAPEARRAAAQEMRRAMGRPHGRGRLSGLLFGDADRFLLDLAMGLEVRAALTEFKAAAAAGRDAPRALRTVLNALVPYQQRLGFADAYGGPLHEEFNQPLARLGDPRIDAVLKGFDEWRDTSVRNGIALKLLDAAESYCRRTGA